MVVGSHLIIGSGQRPVSSIAALRRDHSDIDSMCSVLDALAVRLNQGRYVDPQMLAGVLGFFDRFFGESHQMKEEQGLFPLLSPTSRSAAALVSLLVVQHAAQRAMIRDLSDQLQQLSQDRPAVRESLALTARTYIASVREHLRIEDQWFPEVAAPLLSPQDDECLCRQFEHIERLGIGATGREWYNQVIADYRDIVSTW